MSTIIIRITGTASQVSGQLGKLIAEHGPNTKVEELKKYEGE